MNEDLINEAKDRHRRAADHQTHWRTEAKEDYGMVAGDQWNAEDIAHLEEELRPVVTFNRVQPLIDAVGGTEVTNRQEVRYIPRQQGDAAVNELLTNAAKWVRDECDAGDEESEAFLDAVIAGYGWTNTFMAYDEDPDGMVRIDRVDPFEMYWDPSARKRNLSDMQWLMRIKRMTRSEIEMRWPDKDLENLAGPGWETEPEDAEDPHDATAAPFYKNDQSGRADKTMPLYQVVEYQWYELVGGWRIPVGGRVRDVDEATMSRIRPELEARGIPFVKSRVRAYKRAFLCGDEVLDGPNDIPGFTYRAITAKRDRNRNLWYGLVRGMKDPQRWSNKFFSQILHIINSNAKGGVMFEAGAVIDPDTFEENWARADSAVQVNDGALANGKIIPKPTINYPSGLDNMLNFAIHSIRDVAGINLELLGMADRQQAGILEHQRKQAGLTILGSLFDSLRRYRKEQGRLLIKFIQEYISDGRLVRIDGELGPQYTPLIKQDDTITYDVIVDDAPTSPNQKERMFGLMMQLMPFLADLGMKPPPEMLDYLPLPTAFVAKWKQSMMQPNPLQQAAQQAQVKGAMAKAFRDEATGKLTEARIMEIMDQLGLERTRVEAEARKDLAEAGLKDEELALEAQGHFVDLVKAHAQANKPEANGDGGRD